MCLFVVWAPALIYLCYDHSLIGKDEGISTTVLLLQSRWATVGYYLRAGRCLRNNSESSSQTHVWVQSDLLRLHHLCNSQCMLLCHRLETTKNYECWTETKAAELTLTDSDYVIGSPFRGQYLGNADGKSCLCSSKQLTLVMASLHSLVEARLKADKASLFNGEHVLSLASYILSISYQNRGITNKNTISDWGWGNNFRESIEATKY